VRVFAWSSKFSYTLYVTHFPVAMLAFSLFRPSLLGYGLAGHLLGALVSILLAIAAAYAIAPLVENFSRRKSDVATTPILKPNVT
jgi:peptidoglycan/LPS O-acetylase OafA/YrhL